MLKRPILSWGHPPVDSSRSAWRFRKIAAARRGSAIIPSRLSRHRRPRLRAAEIMHDAGPPGSLTLSRLWRASRCGDDRALWYLDDDVPAAPSKRHDACCSAPREATQARSPRAGRKIGHDRVPRRRAQDRTHGRRKLNLHFALHEQTPLARAFIHEKPTKRLRVPLAARGRSIVLGDPPTSTPSSDP